MGRPTTDGLTTKQESAIVALLKEPTLTKAAKVAGVGERTLHRWLRERTFADKYREARREAFSHAISLTQKYAPAAVAALTQVMADSSAPHSAKVQAASTLLRFGRQGIELDDLAARIEALESAEADQA